MRNKMKNTIVLLSTFCVLSALAAGCGTGSTPSAGMAADETSSTDIAEETESPDIARTEPEGQESSNGKWHVLDPATAKETDADFLGTVWQIGEGAFAIAETKIEILEDDSIVSSSPSSNATIPDSELVHVVVDEDTYFYIRTVFTNGETYEDTAAGFQDLEEHMSVEMKGSFENDIFHASEIRMIKIS